MVELVQELAREIEGNAARFAEAERYRVALLTALNDTHINGYQDGLCVYEGIAMVLGQLIGSQESDQQHGAIAYISDRALHHGSIFHEKGLTATHMINPHQTDL